MLKKLRKARRRFILWRMHVKNRAVNGGPKRHKMREMKGMKRIILASASPRRREILKSAGVHFEVITSDTEEATMETDPSAVVEELSYRKAMGVEMDVKDPEAVIIGSDTIVACGGKILGKPADEKEAFSMLTLLQGRTHQVYTGVTILYGDGKTRKRKTFHECTDVTCCPVSEEEILEYIRSGEPMDKAGAYAIQGGWGVYVEKICGDYNTVVGLPAARLVHEAKKLGIDLREKDGQGGS